MRVPYFYLQALLDGAPGLNFTAKADGVTYRINMAAGQINAGTAVTDFQAFEDVIGKIPVNVNRIVITKVQARLLEQDLGLPTGRVSNGGGILSIVSNVAERMPRSPISGNGFFLGGGKGLPNGAPEVNVAPINTAGGGGIRQIIVEVESD